MPPSWAARSTSPTRPAQDFLDAWEDFTWEPTCVEFGPGGVLIDGEMSGRGRASGAEVAMGEHHVWTLSNGRVMRLRMFVDRGDALAAAGISLEA